MQAQEEKRAAQLKTFDIEDDDYDTSQIVKSNGQGAGGSKKKNMMHNQTPQIPGLPKTKTEEKGENSKKFQCLWDAKVQKLQNPKFSKSQK